jgi:acyl-CoA thioester hydrolase
MQQADTRSIAFGQVADTGLSHRLTLRVRYSETDQMGTFYNSRALEWFEVARTEIMRAQGTPYTQWEKQGYLLPLVESHVFYRGRARYDDLLQLDVSMAMAGRASLRFDVRIVQVESGQAVADGYTVHAIVDPSGRPTRPPRWLADLLALRK